MLGNPNPHPNLNRSPSNLEIGEVVAWRSLGTLMR